MNISVDGIQSSRGNNSNLHEKSIMLDGNSGQEDDKKKKDDQRGDLAVDFKPTNVQLNLENLVKIEDKLTFLLENLRQSKFQ